MSAVCGFEWYTGIKKRVKHVCGEASDHVGDHVCEGKLCAAKKENDRDVVPEASVDESVLDVSISDTHIERKSKQKGFGVREALCGARNQELFGRAKGCSFAPAPDAATCPRCRKLGGL